MPKGYANLPLRQAKDAGHKRYDDSANPCWCGCTIKYVSNSTCVDCGIAKGKARYAALTKAERAALKSKDHVRYLKRLNAGRAPQ